MLRMVMWVLVAGLVLCSCEPREQAEPERAGGGRMDISLSSSAFEDGGIIPARYTADGEDVSPPLAWGAVPAGTRSLALICDDPDAPRGTWVHWVIFNIPPETRELPEAVPAEEVLADGARQGRNDFGRIGYGGPAPPPGRAHRYFFKLYALDTVLELEPGATKAQLLEAMKGHILAAGQLMGRYQR